MKAAIPQFLKQEEREAILGADLHLFDDLFDNIQVIPKNYSISVNKYWIKLEELLYSTNWHEVADTRLIS